MINESPSKNNNPIVATMCTKFTMSFMTVGSAGTPAPTPAPPPPPASHVRQVLHEHRPREMLDNLSLIIMDQTYNALLEILGPEAPPRSGENAHVQVTRPVDPTDPASPLLSVNASATHCCIGLIDSPYGPDYTSPAAKPRWRNTPQHRLRRATITASPGKLHIARVVDGDGGGGGGRGDHWTCAEGVRPDVANRGLLGVLDAIKARVRAAIRLEALLLGKARESGCHRSPEAREIAVVCLVLMKMRAAVDVDLFMCRRKRPVLIHEEITCRLDSNRACYEDEAEMLAKRLSAMHVGHKRGVQETSCQQGDDDAEVLAKRFRTLRV